MPKETRRERFIRIVERRVNQLLKNLDSLGKCANKKNYEYADKDIRKIFSEIDKKTKEIKLLYTGTANGGEGFKLE